ncbi:uncharacterized protein LOC125665958 isoform X2 [Ostrea edulis]|uniref:uncharacterized protein LOC125665958 isoform X2 n=1 Tax=Ostrea edulis TaxID=37623 RepID=UPI0024AFE70D|nr:uncharacterized protein LOC125665958 isoform X2 [Ostrea edulis]
MLSVLFFLIIFDTMQRVGYVKIGVQPDLTTFITLLFLFGPPRIVEVLLVTDFTSRVHMKHFEIKEIVEGMRNVMNDNSVTTVNILSEPEISQLMKCALCNCIYRKCKTNFEHPKIYAPKQSANDSGIEVNSKEDTESVTREKGGQNLCCSEDGQNCCCCCCRCCCCRCCCCCVLRFIYTLCCACICPVHLQKCLCCLILKVKKDENSIDVKTYPFEIECCCISLPGNQEDTNPKTLEDTNPKTSEDTNPINQEDTDPITQEGTNLITQDTNPINQDTKFIALEDIPLLNTEEDTGVEDTPL